MINKTLTGLAFLAGCGLAMAAMPAQAQYYPASPQPMGPPELVTNGPQASRGDFGDWSARRNNIESAHYDRLLETNRGFRMARMRKECGPIADPEMHNNCMASFNQYEPPAMGYGSSAPRWRYPSNSGR